MAASGADIGAAEDVPVETLPAADEGGPAGETTGEAASETPAEASAEAPAEAPARSEEHTSELQSLMRISYAVFCLKKKKKNTYAHDDNATKLEEININRCR